jgi:hypothetical protein
MLCPSNIDCFEFEDLFGGHQNIEYLVVKGVSNPFVLDNFTVIRFNGPQLLVQTLLSSQDRFSLWDYWLI